MNWHTDVTWVDEYVDGALSADTARLVEAHLAVCPVCAAMVADVQTIRSLSASLETHEPPPRVWATLSTVVETPPRRWSLFSLPPFGLQQAAALAMALLMATGLWWVGGRLTPLPESGRLNIAAPVMTAGVGSVPMQMAEAQYTDAIAGLEQMTNEQQGALDADTIGVVQANLSVIDAAITESRAVLQAEPESEVAQQSLFEALRSKVQLLQDVLALINEMRQGDPNGAARIVSGLNH